MPENPLAVTTIVSTPLIDAIAKGQEKGNDSYAPPQVEARRVLTGFKYIGEIMNGLSDRGEDSRFLLGFEESCGYLTGTHVRDKDGVNAAMLIAEMAGLYKSRGITLVDRLSEIYSIYGCCLESLEEFTRPGESGMKEIAAIMAKFREPGIASSFKTKVERYKDYAPGIDGLPSADVLSFDFEGGGKAIIRPSGTEPKLKIYFSSTGATEDAAGETMKKIKDEVLSAM